MDRSQVQKKTQEKIMTRRQRYEAAAKEFDARLDRMWPWYRKLHRPIGLVDMNKVFLVAKAIDDAELRERSAKSDSTRPKVKVVGSKWKTKTPPKKRK